MLRLNEFIEAIRLKQAIAEGSARVALNVPEKEAERKHYIKPYRQIIDENGFVIYEQVK